MMESTLMTILVFVGIIFAVLFIIGMMFARLYKRSSKEVSFVRTGLGGEKVILGGGAFVFPVLHEVIPVNMNTLRLEVKRAEDQALITRDRMRVDVMAEFYVRVKPTAESIATAAQTLGHPERAPRLPQGGARDQPDRPLQRRRRRQQDCSAQRRDAHQQAV